MPSVGIGIGIGLGNIGISTWTPQIFDEFTDVDGTLATLHVVAPINKIIPAPAYSAVVPVYGSGGVPQIISGQMQNVAAAYTSGGLTLDSKISDFIMIADIITADVSASAGHGLIFRLTDFSHYFYVDLVPRTAYVTSSATVYIYRKGDVSGVQAFLNIWIKRNKKYSIIVSCQGSIIEFINMTAGSIITINDALNQTMTKHGLLLSANTGISTKADNLKIGTWYQPIYPKGVAFVGDSLTAGTGSLLGGYPDLLRPLITKDYGYAIFAVGGYLIDPNLIADAVYVNAYYNAKKPLNLLMLWIGSNEARGGVSLVTYVANLTSYCNARRAVGFGKIILFTILPRVDITDALEILRLSYNTWLRVNYATIAEGLVDVAADVRLQTATDETYFYIDHIHLNDTGYGVVSELAQPILTGLL